MKVVVRDPGNPEHVAAAEAATKMLNLPEVKTALDREVSDEVARQLIYGLPPSEGVPDVRPRYPRFKN